MTSRQLVLNEYKNGNLKVTAWIRKAGGIDAVTEERAAQIARVCKLERRNHERKTH